jgi:hypothetical protein
MPQGNAWNKIKAEIAPEDKRVIRENRDLFWSYISDRNQIWVRRNRGEKPPWTDDPILQRNHFTNVFRRYDAGTQHLVDLISTNLKRAPKGNVRQSVIWWVIQYRLPNYPALFEKYGWIPRKFLAAQWLRRIERMHAQGYPWFTNAHIVLQSNFGQSRADNYMMYLKGIDENLEQIVDGILKARTMEEAYRSLLKTKGLGPFTCQEVLIDLTYFGVIPEEWRDEFAIAGPGAMQGVDLIYPQAKQGGQRGYLEAMRTLRDNQHKAFRRLKIPKPVHSLVLHDIEFSLCEFSKYVKIMHGTGRGRLYRPRTA